MATVQPPRSLQEWRRWADHAARYRAAWLPQKIALNWPDGVTEDAAWIPLADDHPFKGYAFCWRCLVEAGSLAHGNPDPPHRSSEICFEAARDQAPEHAEPDSESTRPRPALDLGFGPEFADTGSFFWEGK